MKTKTGNPVKVLILLCHLILIVQAYSAGAQSTTALGPFEKQLRTNNPLREAIHPATRPMPTVFDHNKDGDLDIVIADYYNGNGFKLIRNDGTVSLPAFNYAEGPLENPFYQVAFGARSAPTFTDLDKDGDADMLLGLQNGTIQYYINKATTVYPYALQSGAWSATTKTGNPFFGIDLGDFTRPVFTDFDNDGDADVIVGTSFLPNNQSIYYYENDGSGNFTQKTLSGINPAVDEVTPTMIDINGDGLKDIIIGCADGSIHYFKCTGTAAYTEQTGNLNPFNNFNEGAHSAPASGDFDGDGDLDLVLAAANPEQNLFYFENKGNGIFQRKDALASPVGGLNVTQMSSPYFSDVNNDGSIELLLGGFEEISYYKKNGDFYEKQTTDPFSNLVYRAFFVTSLVDLDGDGDKDLVGGQNNNLGNDASIAYYKNDNGIFTLQDFHSGPFKDVIINEGKTEFADIDNDGDFDFFISDQDNFGNQFFIRFFKNTGTAQAPQFVELTGSQNPLGQINESNLLFPRLVDLDHDSDLDVVIGVGGGVAEFADGNKVMYYENTGTSTAPVFVYRGQLTEQGENPYNPAPSFTDIDDDGDLDIFLGGQDGNLTYYKNTNPAAQITFSSNTSTVSPNTKLPLDAQLTLSDVDNDLIFSVTVAIVSYESGKENLTFTSQNGITGNFNSATGVLSLSGKETIATYQSLLRSVTYEYTGTSSATVSKTIQIQVRDADRTKYTTQKNLSVLFNHPPAIQDYTTNIKANSTASIDLSSLVSDPEGVNDIDWSTFVITAQPSSGAIATLDGAKILHVDYSSIHFAGTETVTIHICDKAGACTENVISIVVDPITQVIIYNAIAPHGIGDNRFMRIANLPSSNKVTIFNRWGDEVYAIENYDHDLPGKRFEGISSSGKNLPSGTYFYIIEFDNLSNQKQKLTGYLSLVQ